jgi:hypothetical protein
MKTYWGNRRLVPFTLNLATTQVSGRYTYRLLCPREKVPVQLNRGLGGPQSRSGHFGEEKNLCRHRNNSIRAVNLLVQYNYQIWSKSVKLPNFRNENLGFPRMAVLVSS